MSTQQLKMIGLLIWGGAGLLILGLLLSLPALAPYLEAAWSPSTAGKAFVAITSSPTATAFPPTSTAAAVPVIAAQSTLLTPRPSLTPLPPPTPTPHQGTKPCHIRIPAIDLDAPVVPIGWKAVEIGGAQQPVWDVPDWRAAGWHRTSAELGVPGNTVLNGHNTSKGEVFRDLYKLEVGALILIRGEDDKTYTYRVGEKHILPEAGQPLEVRLKNASYIQPTEDERVTLVTCHPYGSLANRLVIVAYPAPKSETVPTGEE